MKSSMNLLAGAALMLMARAGETNGGSAAEKELAQKIAADVAANDPSAYHHDLVKAVMNDVSEEDIKQAIRDNWDTLKLKLSAETQEAGAEAFIENEYDGATFMAFIGGLGSPFGDLDDDE